MPPEAARLVSVIQVVARSATVRRQARRLQQSRVSRVWRPFGLASHKQDLELSYSGHWLCSASR